MADPVTRGAAKVAALIALPLALLAGLLAFWRLGGFDGGSKPAANPPNPGATSVVSMPVPTLNPSDATMCLAFVAQLPDKLGALPQRPVSAGGNQQNAAYGDPPVTVACGGPQATNRPLDAQLVLTRVCWWADDSDPAATLFTTLDRQVPIRVRIPKTYEGQLIQEFTNPIVASVPSLPQVPAICQPPAVATS